MLGCNEQRLNPHCVTVHSADEVADEPVLIGGRDEYWIMTGLIAGEFLPRFLKIDLSCLPTKRRERDSERHDERDERFFIVGGGLPNRVHGPWAYSVNSAL